MRARAHPANPNTVLGRAGETHRNLSISGTHSPTQKRLLNLEEREDCFPLGNSIIWATWQRTWPATLPLRRLLATLTTLGCAGLSHLVLRLHGRKLESPELAEGYGKGQSSSACGPCDPGVWCFSSQVPPSCILDKL